MAAKTQPERKTVFRYDGIGRRPAIVSPDGVETRYLWCGEAICQARDSRDAVSRRYYAEGEMIPGAGRLYYANDHLGSVRDLLSLDDGSRVASFDYDPYGNPARTDGSVASDFRYSGMFYHSDSGLYLTRYRAYDPRTGRWLSRDPMGENGGANLYGYVDGNPVAKVDPKGDIGILYPGPLHPIRDLTNVYGFLTDRIGDGIFAVYSHYARNNNNVVVPLNTPRSTGERWPPKTLVGT